MSLATRVSALATRVGQEMKILKDRPVIQVVNIQLLTSVGSRGRGTVTLPIPIDAARGYVATASPIGLAVSEAIMPVATVSHPFAGPMTEISVAATALIGSAGTITWAVQVIGYPASTP